MPAYSFLDTLCSIVGPGGTVNLASGASASDEGITITPVDANTMTIGADGAVMHSLHGDRSGKIEISLLKTSPVNAKLSLMFNLQRASSANHGQNSISLANNQIGDVVTCEAVAFKKAPTMKWGKDGGMLVWELDVGRIPAVVLGANL